MSAGFRIARAATVVCLAVLFTGCTTIELHPNRDPCGGALTDVEAQVYDVDANGIWYVVFLRCDDLLLAAHRHNPGVHAFFSPAGDVLYFSRCSGRGEVIVIAGQTFALRNGSVFLCDMTGAAPQTWQLQLPPPPCNGTDPAGVARALYALSQDARVAAFLSPEARLRLQADVQLARRRKEQAPMSAAPVREVR